MAMDGDNDSARVDENKWELEKGIGQRPREARVGWCHLVWGGYGDICPLPWLRSCYTDTVTTDVGNYRISEFNKYGKKGD